MWYVKLPESIFLKSENIGLDRPQKSPGAACSGASKKPAAWGAGPRAPAIPWSPRNAWGFLIPGGAHRGSACPGGTGAGAQDGSPWAVVFQRRVFDHEQMVDLWDFMGVHGISCYVDLIITKNLVYMDLWMDDFCLEFMAIFVGKTMMKHQITGETIFSDRPIWGVHDEKEG